MGTEDLDKRNLQGWNLSVQEDTSQVELHLETNVHICSVYGRRPPQGETTVGDLIETGALCVGEFLEFHGLCEERC